MSQFCLPACSVFFFCIKCVADVVVVAHVVVTGFALFFITFILLPVAKSQCQGVGHMAALLMHIYSCHTASAAGVATANFGSSMHK